VSRRDFDRLLLEAVDASLSSLGDSAKKTIYFHLKTAFDIKKRDIPNKLEEFNAAMEKTFGLGYKFLDILIIKHLYEKVGQRFKYKPVQQDLMLSEYVKAARQNFLKTKT
jgi:hypothetical protein